MKESAMLWYPNRPQKGCALMIGLDDGRTLSLTDFTDKVIRFEAEAGTTVNFIKLFVQKGHALNGALLIPRLHLRGSTTNLITWPFATYSKSHMSDGVSRFNNSKADFAHLETNSGDHGIQMWVWEKPYTQTGLWYKQMRTSGVVVDTEYFFVDGDNSFVLPTTGTYILENTQYLDKNWDVAIGSFSQNSTGFRPSGKFPNIHNALYFEDEGGWIWEKKLPKERYWIGYGSYAPVEIMKDDYTIVCSPHFSYTCKTKTAEGKEVTYSDLYWGPGALKQTKDFFVKIYNNNNYPCGLFLVSRNLVEWKITEIPKSVITGLASGSILVSRNNNKLLIPKGTSTNPTAFRLFSINSDGSVTDNGEIPKPSDFNSPNNNAFTFDTDSRVGSILYIPTVDDEPGQLVKHYSGIDNEGNHFKSPLVRRVQSGGEGRAFNLGNALHGFGEDAVFITYTQKVGDDYVYHTHLITSTDGFKTVQSVGPLPLPNYTLYGVYNLPKYGTRLAFYRRDVSTNERLYDVYDKNGNIIEYAVAAQANNGRVFEYPTITLPAVGWNMDESNWRNRHGVKEDGTSSFNWLPPAYNGTSKYVNTTGNLMYTEGNGPAPPDVSCRMLNDGMFLSGHVLYSIWEYDTVGRPKQTSENRGFAFDVAGCRTAKYIEDCKHPGKHFTTRLAWVNY